MNPATITLGLTCGMLALVSLLTEPNSTGVFRTGVVFFMGAVVLVVLKKFTK